MADLIFKNAAAQEEQENVTQRLGRTLQYEREKQGLSVESVAGQLCLSVAVIRSIEAGHMADLPELVYVRGYVRAYCKMLKIDPEPFLEDYVFNLSPPRDDDVLPAMDEHVHRLTRLWGSLAVFTVVALLVTMWWMDQTEEFGELPPQPVLVPAPPQTPTQTPEPALQSFDAFMDEKPPAFVPQPQQPRPVLDEKLVEITIHALDKSWAYATDGSGEEIIHGMLFVGYQRTVYGVFPFEFKFGDARSVRLWVDGEEYDVNQHISQLNTAFFTLQQPIQ